MTRRVLITGASGFLGKNQLLFSRDRWQITAVYHQQQDFPQWLRDFGADQNVTAIRCDLTNPEDVQRLFTAGYDAILHLAANGDPAHSVKHPDDDLRKNTLTTLNLLQHVPFKRFVYFSSGAVYHRTQGNVSPQTPVEPTLPYAISNLASERYVQSLAGHREHIVVRFFGAYGPFEPERKIYTRLVRAFAIEHKNTFQLQGDGRNLIDAMAVKDACEIIHRIVEDRIQQPVIDVGSGTPVTLRALVEEAARIFGVKNLKIDCIGSVPEYIEFRMDAVPLKNIYGFAPRISLADGLRELHRHLKTFDLSSYVAP